MVSGSREGFRERFLANVEVRMGVIHSAKGELEMGADVVWDWKRVEGRRWASVMSGGFFTALVYMTCGVFFSFFFWIW